MGAGKTTTGQMLAKRLGWGWHDLDIDIEASTGKTVRELRDSEGVDAMHRREAVQLLDALASPEPNVVSAAASVVEDPVACAAMTKPGVAVIWLHASLRSWPPGSIPTTSTDRRTARIPRRSSPRRQPIVNHSSRASAHTASTSTA